VIERDPAAALLFVQRLAEHGTSYPQFIHDLLRHLRQVFLVQYFSDVSDDRAKLAALSQNLEIDEQLLDRLSRQASQLPGRELLRLIELLGSAQTEIRGGLDPRLQLEMALVKAARPEVDHSPDALEERLRRLESGSVPFAPSPAPKPAAGGAAAARVVAAVTPKPAAPKARPPEPAAAAADAESEAAEAKPETTARAKPGTAGTKPRTVAEAAPDADEAAEATTAVAAAAAPDAEPEAAEAAPSAEEAEAAPAEAEPDGGAGRVKRAWQLVLQQAEAQNVTLYAAIKDARVHADGETLVVALPSSLTFGRASSPANRELLGAIILRTTGDTPELQYELAGDQAAPSSAPRAAEPDAGLTIAERIALAKRELDASELPDDD
jgi:DNA polymerase III subunit gamma/tau